MLLRYCLVGNLVFIDDIALLRGSIIVHGVLFIPKYYSNYHCVLIIIRSSCKPVSIIIKPLFAWNGNYWLNQ